MLNTGKVKILSCCIKGKFCCIELSIDYIEEKVKGRTAYWSDYTCYVCLKYCIFESSFVGVNSSLEGKSAKCRGPRNFFY